MSESALKVFRFPRAAASLGLVLLTIAAFQPVLGNGFVDYDDPDYVTKNPWVISGLTTAGAAWALTATEADNWHPVTWLAHMLDATLFGLNPAGHHATSVLWHAATAVLLFLVLARLTGHTWRSLAVAAIFAVHPLRVESVAWAAEKKDLLGGFFWVLTLGAYLGFCRRPGAGRYALVLLLFVLGLAAKPMLVTLPLILLLIDWWPLGRLAAGPGRVPGPGWASAARLVLEKLPLLLLAAGASVITFQIQRNTGAVKEYELIPFVPRLLNAALSTVRYLGMTLWPTNLSPIYPHPGPNLSLVAAFFAIGALLVLTLVAARRREEQPWLFFGWVWYLISLSPVVGIVQVGWQAMADRYTYLPLIGPVLALTWTAAGSVALPRRRYLAYVIGALLIPLVIVTRHQTTFWHDNVRFFTRAVSTTENNTFAEFYLAEALRQEHHPEEAERHLLTALRINPFLPELYNEMGLVARERGDIAAAVRWFERAVELAPQEGSVHLHLAEALERRGDPARALEEYLAAAAIDPANAQAHINAALLLSRFGREAEAIEQMRQAKAAILKKTPAAGMR
ncbi:MAG: tetratricopeptide repeat protein [Candidatus Methylomirabilia bacterium]